MTNLWKHEDITGADLSGSDGDTGRMYQLVNLGAILPGFQLVVSGAIFQNLDKFTLSGNVITFIPAVFDNAEISIDYQIVESTEGSTLIGYTDTFQVARISGVAPQITNENLGTGNNTNADFDVKNGKLISGSVCVKYSSSVTDNTFIKLTEQTDYNVDLDGGLITLTASGVSALDDNILWIDYHHSPKISDSDIASYFAAAEEEVNKKTGNYWGPTITNTEFFDGRNRHKYPTTDNPYLRLGGTSSGGANVGSGADWTQPDKVQLEFKSVQSIQGVFFLNQGQALGQVERFDSVGNTFTDVTEEANTPAGVGFQPFADVTAVGDYLYIGAINQFLGVSFNLFTKGATESDNTIEYWNANTELWTEFTASESKAGVLNFECPGDLTWGFLDSWDKTTVDNGSALYFIRVKAGGTYTTEASINSSYMNQDLVIGTNLPLYTISWDDTGRISLLQNRIPDGNRIVRVDYQHGYSETPDEVAELTAEYVAVRVFANISGGSYDDATGFTLGRKTVSIGEVYVNIREVVNEAQDRIKELLLDLGKKKNVAVAI